MLEKDMRRQLKHKFLIEMSHAIFQPIESGATGTGIPDIYFKTTYEEGWIELKEVTATPHGTISIPWRPGQLNWIRRYTQLSGSVILLMTYKKSIHTIGWEKIWVAIKSLDIMYEYNSTDEFEAAASFIGHLKELDLMKLLKNRDTRGHY